MSLKLSLAQTGLTWTLTPKQNKNSYTIGTDRRCDIRLPADPVQPCPSIELRYSPGSEQWSLQQVVNKQGGGGMTAATPIFDQSLIRLNSSLLLVAHLDAAGSDRALESLVTSTRLLCGYAYKEGVFGGFELLNQLRTDPYKGKFAKSSIDTDQVTRHSTQSILLSVLVASAVLFVALLQWVAIAASGQTVAAVLLSLPPWLMTLAVVSGLVMGFETVYLRWAIARKFLKKRYDKTFSIKPLEPLSNYFRQGIYHPIDEQNVIVFGSYAPFVGAGEAIPASRWTVPVARALSNPEMSNGLLTASVDSEFLGQERYVDIPVNEFYETVDHEVESLNLPGLQKTSQLFVDGFELGVDGKILDSPTARPAAVYLDDPTRNEEQQESGSRLRSYRLYRYIDVERDYILSHFLRFHNAGEVTFIESSAYILTGIDRRRYSLVSTLDDSHLTRIIKAIFAGIFLGVTQLYIALAGWYVGCFIYNVLAWRWNDMKQRRAAELQEEYNYGIEQTLREYVAEPLNMDENRKLHLNHRSGQQPSFLTSLNLRKIFSNPILLGSVFLLGPVLLPFAAFITAVMWFLNLYKKTIGTFSTNLDYYGTQDVFLYWKAIQDAIFSGAIKLLKEYDVDTTALEGISTQIISNSVTVSAGNITGSQVVIGSDISSAQAQGTSAA